MNYYPRYPAHYVAKTLQLSMLEDGAYTRLLDWYYANEKAIPHGQRYAIARANKPNERRAVDTVLDSFFDQNSIPDGDWICARVEKEIALAKPKIAAARENGKLGGRPKNTDLNKPTGFSETVNSGNPVGSETKPTGLTPQSPYINQNQNQDQKQKQPPAKKPPAARELVPEPPDWVDQEVWEGFATMRKRQRVPLTARAARLIVLELEKLREQGHDPAVVLDQSTRNGWRDVYPLRGLASNPRGSPTKPPIAQDFRAKTYTGTDDHDLPAYLRAANT